MAIITIVHLSEQTRDELRAIRQGIHLPEEYASFMIHWIVFNRAYNELRYDEEENNRIIGLGDDMKQFWPDMTEPARSLVSMECIGADRMAHQTLLRPNRVVKSATIFLRYRLRITPAFPNCATDPSFCRANKASICQPVNIDPWQHSEMAALLRLVYQVRCNLIHGDKVLTNPDSQTNRDRQLVAVSIEILNKVFGWLS